MSDIIGGIFGMIIAIGGLGLFYWLIFYSLNKYGGITFTSRHNVNRQNQMNQIFHKQNLKEISKYDTETIQRAQENLSKKLYAKTSDNLLLEVQKIGNPKIINKPNQVEQDKLLNLVKVQRIFNSRNSVSVDHLKQRIIIKVLSVSAETPYKDYNGVQYTDAFKDDKPVFKKTLFCNLNSKIAINGDLAIAILKYAYQLEKMQEYEEAHKAYSEYLKTIQLNVSLLSSNKYYDEIKAGSEIVGEVEHFKANKIEFLTIKSSSIVLKV